MYYYLIFFFFFCLHLGRYVGWPPKVTDYATHVVDYKLPIWQKNRKYVGGWITVSLWGAAVTPPAVPPYACYEAEDEQQHAKADTHKRASAVHLRPVNHDTYRHSKLYLFTQIQKLEPRLRYILTYRNKKIDCGELAWDFMIILEVKWACVLINSFDCL